MSIDERKAQSNLLKDIVSHAQKAFDPSYEKGTRLGHIKTFESLLESTSTCSLLSVLSTLVQPGRTSPWIREQLTSALARLPLRPKGVQNTIEFVISIHPSSTVTSNAEGTGKRSCISHEAMNAVSRLLSSPPAASGIEYWFNGIAPQLLSLLDGDGDLEMDKVAAFIIGFGILGRKIYGSIGKPGWRAFVEPIYAHICPSAMQCKSQIYRKYESIDVEILSMHRILSTAEEVYHALQRLQVLVTSHPHPSLANRLLRPILLPLWAIFWRSQEYSQVENSFGNTAKNLLTTLLRLAPGSNSTTHKGLLNLIIDDLMFQGKDTVGETGWIYVLTQSGIHIEEIRLSNQTFKMTNLENVDLAISIFVTLMSDLPELKNEVSALFMKLISSYLSCRSKDFTTQIHTHEVDFPSDTIAKVIGVKLMQKMLVTLPEMLIDNSLQLLELINQVLSDWEAICHEDSNADLISVALSLLNVVLTSRFQRSKAIDHLFESIQKSLEIISRQSFLEVSRTSKNLLMLLTLHDTIIPTESDTTVGKRPWINKQTEEKKSYDLAMSYLTSLDSPPPVKVQGLEIISQLIGASSSILDIPALILLLITYLRDNEEYVYLKIINLLVQLSRWHPKTVMRDLMDQYVDSNEECELDQRLRLGETLLQVIEKNRLDFNLEAADTLCRGLLFLGSRRGYRPKSYKLREKTVLPKVKQEVENIETSSELELSLDNDNDTSLQAEDLLCQIVAGWESKRGEEDVRIRSSAITIFGAAISTNIEGISSRLASASLELSLQILGLEPELEKGILRRAAVLLIMNFLKSLDSSRARKRSSVFDFTGQGVADIRRVLQYIEATDNDGLVQQHAKDVLESLEALQIKCLNPPLLHNSRKIIAYNEMSILSTGPKSSHSNPIIEEIE
ncbi:BgTH12-06310 [Blumeria graminis f. sp. triticale]|uniref:BgTH12-06310 n=1 Tax=Blumeria graminis f. sp. triticale TaxID=1689686 RepID=A0A9W4GE82_BLUGR|nr:BgTH12-06310 [Blumeria graminis f. sp. triticale]